MSATIGVVEPDRFDDVSYEIVELSDAPRGRRVSTRAAAIAAGVLAAVALSAGAALALTPTSAPSPPAPPRVPAHFAADRYPARGSQAHRLNGGNCLHLHARAAAAPFRKL